MSIKHLLCVWCVISALVALLALFIWNRKFLGAGDLAYLSRLPPFSSSLCITCVLPFPLPIRLCRDTLVSLALIILWWNSVFRFVNNYGIEDKNSFWLISTSHGVGTRQHLLEWMYVGHTWFGKPLLMTPWACQGATCVSVPKYDGLCTGAMTTLVSPAAAYPAWFMTRFCYLSVYWGLSKWIRIVGKMFIFIKIISKFLFIYSNL